MAFETLFFIEATFRMLFGTSVNNFRLSGPIDIVYIVVVVSRRYVRPVLSDHIKQDIFWLFRQMVAYCCMKVVQKAFCATLIQ